MPRLRSIRFRRGRKKHRETELQLTSMMDVLVIILVFLLKSYSTSTNNFTTLPGLKLPISGSQDLPPDSLHLIITPEGMTFENERIVEFELTSASLDSEASYTIKKTDLAEDSRRITPLFDALVKAEGPERATFLLRKLLDRARTLHVAMPPVLNTPYQNSVSLAQQPQFPGNLDVGWPLLSLAMANLFAGAVLQSLLYLRTRSLAMPIGLHFGWNLLEGPLLGLQVSGHELGGLHLLDATGPDWLSGGSFGPEGGLPATCVTVAGILLLALVRRRSLSSEAA